MLPVRWISTSRPAAGTLDGSSPSEQSPIFGAPFTLSGTTTVKAQAFKADMLPSAVVSATYTINLSAVEPPALSVAAGRYTTARTVTISCPTADATIHYTTNGNEPTTSDASIASGGTLNVDRAMIVKAKAFHATLPASATGTPGGSGSRSIGISPQPFAPHRKRCTCPRPSTEAM